jgi:hypothetical protein
VSTAAAPHWLRCSAPVVATMDGEEAADILINLLYEGGGVGAVAEDARSVASVDTQEELEPAASARAAAGCATGEEEDEAVVWDDDEFDGAVGGASPFAEMHHGEGRTVEPVAGAHGGGMEEEVRWSGAEPGLRLGAAAAPACTMRAGNRVPFKASRSRAHHARRPSLSVLTRGFGMRTSVAGRSTRHGSAAR